MKKTTLLIVFCFLTLGNIWGQEKEISRDEYFKIFRESNSKFYNATKSRSISKTEYFNEGKLESTLETITENIKPDRWRFFVVETTDKGKSVSDLIKIDKVYYCKKNDEVWKESKSSCSSGWVSGLSNVFNSKYFVEIVKENGKSLRVFREYIVYKNNYSPNKDKEGFSYWEKKFWLDENGLMIKEETFKGLIEPKKIYSQLIQRYEYNPKDLKIETPIITEK